MEHAGAVGGAAHAGVGDAHHVPYSPFEQLLGDGEQPPLRHTRSPDGACAPENEYGACVHLQVRVVYAPGEVVVAFEDHGRSCMPEQPRVCG